MATWTTWIALFGGVFSLVMSASFFADWQAAVDGLDEGGVPDEEGGLEGFSDLSHAVLAVLIGVVLIGLAIDPP